MSKVLIADDSGIMRSAIVSTLDEDKEIAVIGEVGRQGWFPLRISSETLSERLFRLFSLFGFDSRPTRLRGPRNRRPARC
jgi:DNA-binding NarL/FixJ family response regulator